MEDIIEYRVIGESDRAGVRQFYEAHFLVDEPLSALSDHDPDHEGLRAFTDQVIGDSIRSCVSTVAIDSVTKDIVGIRLCVPSSMSDPNFFTIPEKYQDEVSVSERKNLQMFKDIHNGINVFEMFGVTEAVHMYALSVRKSHRGKGIAGKMINYTLSEAKKLGLSLAFVESSSNSSRRVFEKLGFQKLKELSFEEYFGEKLDTGEHKVLSLHVKSF